MTNIQTPLCRRLGIELPIFGFSHSVAATAAITNAGGYGVYGAARDEPVVVAARLAEIRGLVGKRPFGVDVMLPKGMPDHATLDEVRAELPAEHVAFVDTLRRKYAVPDARGKSFFNSMLRTADFFDGQLEAVFASDVDMIAFGVGFSADVVARAKAVGKLTAALIGLPKHARRALDAGVEVIVAQGAEAGGHTGEVSTLALVPQVVAMAADVPVLAAGGIGHGSQVAAALAMGAEGAWLGTRWLTTLEHALDAAKVEKLLRAGSDDTVVTRASSGKPQRQIRSQWSEEWQATGAPEPLKMPYQHALVGDLITAVEENRIDALLTEPAGQSVAWCEAVGSVAEVMIALRDETAQALDRLNTRLTPA